MKYDKPKLAFFLFIILFIIWGLFANQYGPELVSWIMILLIASIGIIYWRYEPSRNIINKLFSGLSNIFLSVFENENKSKSKKPKKIPRYASVDCLGEKYKPGFERIRLDPLDKQRIARNAGNRCQIWERPTIKGRCNVVDNYPMEVHHINGKPGINNDENLIHICSNHHKIITKTMKWKETEKNSCKFEYKSNQKIHRSYFNYCRTNNRDKILQLDPSYFEFIQIQTRK